MRNLKKYFLNEKYQAPPESQPFRRRRGAPEPQAQGVNDSALWGGAVVITIVALMLSIVVDPSSGAPNVIVDRTTLCPVEEQYIAGETYIHIDLSERLTKEQKPWLLDLLNVAQESDLPTYSLLSISQMQTKSTAPRVSVQKFCIPNIADIGAAGRRVKREDCAEINEDEFEWEQTRTRNIGNTLRENITAACNAFMKLKSQVAQAAERYKKVNLGLSRSYIIGGIEDVMYASVHAENPKIPTRLIVFSDMLQNASWFSQYKTQPDEWTAKTLQKLRKGKNAIKEIGGNPPPSDLQFTHVLLCYLPSAHSILASARNQKAHKQMWADYFKSKIPHADAFRTADASACAPAAKALLQRG